MVRPGAVSDGQRDANPDEVFTQGDDAPNVLGHAGRDAVPIRIFEVGDAPQHTAVFEHVVEVQHLISIQFQGHHLAFWSVRQHERDDHRLGRAQMDGVDVAASLATHAVVVAASFWFGGKDVVPFKLGT